MTIETVRGKFGRTPKVGRPSRVKEPPGPEPIAIGETDRDIFNCPTCARPLAVGSARCPACGTRLIIGVQAKRAAVFIAIGAVMGTMLGGGAMAMASAVARTVEAATVDPAVVSPSGNPAQASGQAPMVDPTVPAAALSALRQSALLNQRIADEASSLADAVRSKPVHTADIARSLRALASDAAFGDRIAPDIARWSEAGDVSAGLSEFYVNVAGTAREGLKASLTNTRAYTNAGREMLVLVATLGDLDAGSRELATRAGMDLPPVTLGTD